MCFSKTTFEGNKNEHEPDEYEEEVSVRSLAVGLLFKRTVHRNRRYHFTLSDGSECVGTITRLYKVVFHFLNPKRQRKKRELGAYIELDSGEKISAEDVVRARAL